MKTKLNLLSFAAFLLLGACAWADPDPNLHVYLCFGQSNMESGGRMNDADRAVDKRFQVLADFDAPNRGWEKGHWYDAVPPLTARGRGISIVDYFGRTMVAKLSAADCWKIQAAGRYDVNPYQYLVNPAKTARKDGVVRGILIHQGESNFEDQGWPGKVRKFHGDLMKDLNLTPEDVTQLAGEMVNADRGGTCVSMNKIMDHLHFTPAGCREPGKRHADTMLAIRDYEVAGPK